MRTWTPIAGTPDFVSSDGLHAYYVRTWRGANVFYTYAQSVPPAARKMAVALYVGALPR